MGISVILRTTEHAGLKRFMLEQIDLCTEYEYKPEPPRKLSAEEWLAAQIELATRDVAYYRKEWTDEVARVKSRNE